MELNKLKDILRDGGVVGAGGAGFPTYAKLDQNADTLILNCAECEPLLKLHRQVLERYAKEILHTLNLIAKAVEAKHVYVAVKRSYQKTIEAVKPLLSFFENIEICELPEVYPAGDEVVLTYEVTGRVVPAGSIPIAVGVTVLNVETVYNAYRALNGLPVTYKFVTIAGAVNNPVTVQAPIGIKIKELLSLAGGVNIENPAFLMGGPMMGKLGSDSEIVTKTTNAVLVLPNDHQIIKKKQTKSFINMKRAMAACCQCSYCTLLCPRNLLGHPIDPSEFMRVASNSITNEAEPYINSLYCSSCGLCEMYSCGQGLSPRSLLENCKTTLRQNGLKPTPVEPNGVFEERNRRQVPMGRLLARLGLNPYNKTAPMSDMSVKAERLSILLSQHIGAPAVPVVKQGDKVKENQLIAEASDGLSVAIHSPVNGTVKAVGKKAIIIMAD
ncbi:MAG: NADH-quinone oxidoreductase subunit J [Ruminococcaceae bacterium]|nr:NADH-quinone oxidoreductase subunit J [Oscillospiraceae bacterium]